MRFNIISLAPAAFAGWALLTGPAAAGMTAATGGPLLVEFFISQACKASPPAAAIADDLHERNDLVTLVYHVDYWDMVAGREGETWRDPFSKPAFAKRHKLYNERIRGKNRAMTPQAVIDGMAAVSAARPEPISTLINAMLSNRPASAAAISIARTGGALEVNIDGAEGEAVLVRFIEEAVTPVEGGDNDGLLFREAHVVTDVARLGALAGVATRFETPPPVAGTGCAVIVQEPGHGRVLAARYCPH